MNSVERFDPRAGKKCVQVKMMNEIRIKASAAEQNGLIYVTGGWNWNETKGSRLDTVEMIPFKFCLSLSEN